MFQWVAGTSWELSFSSNDVDLLSEVVTEILFMPVGWHDSPP